MGASTTTRILPGDALWPERMSERLGASAPKQLQALGNPALLTLPKTSLFCSTRCPGEAILRAHDRAAKWRDDGRCIISGFHSPVEQECLRILLRGTQPIIICPARSLPRRAPQEWQAALASGRLLVLSPFPDTATRITASLSNRRNELVGALADSAWFAYVSTGGQSERLTRRLSEWGVDWNQPE